MRFALEHQLEPDERVLGEYATIPHSRTNGLISGETGILTLTSKRLLYYRQKSILRKLVKRDAPMYELLTAIYLPDVKSVSHGGTFDKWVKINGKKYYFKTHNTRSIAKMIKSTVKDADFNVPVTPSPTVFRPPGAPVPQAQAPPVQSTVKYCTYCGKENAFDARFCNGCGTEMQN